MKSNKSIEELSKKYGCSGRCYGGQEYIDGEAVQIPICHNIDFCEETRKGEFLASVFAVLFVLGTPVFFILLVAFMILG